MKEMVKACTNKNICIDKNDDEENQEVQIDQESLEKKRGCGSSQPKYLLDKLMLKISKRAGDKSANVNDNLKHFRWMKKMTEGMEIETMQEEISMQSKLWKS